MNGWDANVDLRTTPSLPRFRCTNTRLHAMQHKHSIKNNDDDYEDSTDSDGTDHPQVRTTFLHSRQRLTD